MKKILLGGCAALWLMIWSGQAFAASENVGNTTTGVTAYAPGSIVAFKLETLPTHNGTLDNMTYTVNNPSNQTRYAQFALYTHNSTANMPDSLVTNSVMVTGALPNDGIDLTLTPSGTVNIVNGTQYWLVMQSNLTAGIYCHDSGGRMSYKTLPPYGTWPAWNGTETGNIAYRMGKGYLSYSYSTLSATTLNSATAGDQQVTLNWTAVDNATGYWINRGSSSGSYSNFTEAGNVTESTATGLVNGNNYYFTVTAHDASSNATQSNELNATPVILIHKKLMFD